jgi:hypothetical protein
MIRGRPGWTTSPAPRTRRGRAQQRTPPRSDDERDAEGEQHRQAAAHRDGTHVRSHQPADEAHREDRGDDRERRQDGGVPDLVHRVQHGRTRPFLRRVEEVPVHVLHHHDRVVHEMPMEKMSAKR